MNGLVLVGPVGTFTWRLLATCMAGQAIAVFFGALVARALASASGEDASTAYLVVGSGVALACLAAAALMRGRWGITLGWAVQVATLVSAVVVPMMLAISVIFGSIWVWFMVLGRRAEEQLAHRRSESEDADR